MCTQSEKAKTFKALHQQPNAFVIPNPWDAGTAVLLQQLGFKALATTSAGYAFSRAREDNSVNLEEMIWHIGDISRASNLPVSADLGNGFGDAPETVAETIRQAAAAGVVGGSIEDATGRSDQRVYSIEHAVERIRAASEAARNLGYPFVLTARAENFLQGIPDLYDTIRRLQAFQEAGADVLYAPGLKTKTEIAAVVSSVDRPVNVIVGLQGVRFSVAELSELHVRRISLGSALYRTALGAFLRAAQEMKNAGTFEFAEGATPYGDANAMFACRCC